LRDLLVQPQSAQPLKQPSDMSLVGTVSGDRDMSYAIFANMTGQQDIFKIGETIDGLGMLRKVEADKVIIKGRSGDVTFLISDITTAKGGGVLSQPMPSHLPAHLNEAKTSAFAKKGPDGAYFIDQRKIQAAIENPKDFMMDARLLPNYVNGQQEGFVLREVKSGGIYHSLGLQEGDVLLRINDYNITNPDAGLQAFTALKGMDRVQLNIIRRGSKMTMTYQIR
ncbi:MAG: PDZ domain-containing protein, partial [Nitrospirae bacterium]|nr:PDZ domain-containing protein [Nitrospirota bacterium]